MGTGSPVLISSVPSDFIYCKLRTSKTVLKLDFYNYIKLKFIQVHLTHFTGHKFVDRVFPINFVIIFKLLKYTDH